MQNVNVKRTKLARKIAEIMPFSLRNNSITHFAQSGSGAVETAIKFVRMITGKSQIVAFHGAYHGVWLGGNSLTTGNQYRRGFGPFMPDVIHLPYPYCYRCCFGRISGLQPTMRPYADYVLNTPYTGAHDVPLFLSKQNRVKAVTCRPPVSGGTEKSCDKAGALLIADEDRPAPGEPGRCGASNITGLNRI